MEEKTNKASKKIELNDLVNEYINELIDYDEFEKGIIEWSVKYSNSEKVGKNLKPFSLELAKAGKPVCTRDGRKARIICFDRDWDMHIVALVSDILGESVHYYLSNGKVDFDKQDDEDLMMLPEKKEGWVNVYEGGLLDTKSYPTKTEAFDKACPEGYVDTIKINWEE